MSKKGNMNPDLICIVYSIHNVTYALGIWSEGMLCQNIQHRSKLEPNISRPFLSSYGIWSFHGYMIVNMNRALKPERNVLPLIWNPNTYSWVIQSSTDLQSLFQFSTFVQCSILSVFLFDFKTAFRPWRFLWPLMFFQSSGLCIDLFDRLAELIGFNYTIYEVPDQLYGKKNLDTFQWNGLIKELVTKVSSVLANLLCGKTNLFHWST